MGRRRRAPGEGSVYRRKDGKWVGALTVGYGPTGAQRRVVVYGRTRQEAAQKLAEKVAALRRGTLPTPESVTVREWLADWLKRKAAEVRPKTIEHYRYELGRAVPSLRDPRAQDRFGAMRLQAVQPLHIRQLIDHLRGQVSERSLKVVRWLLHAAFEEAVNLELLPRNPVAPVKVKAGRKEKAARILQPEEARKLLAALDAHPSPLALALRLMLACGLRRGEVLALRWEDVDLEAGRLYVRRAWTRVGTRGSSPSPRPPLPAASSPSPSPPSSGLGRTGKASWSKGRGRRSWRGSTSSPPARTPPSPWSPTPPTICLGGSASATASPPSASTTSATLTGASSSLKGPRWRW